MTSATTVRNYRVVTAGPIMTHRGTLEDVKAFVVKYAPLKRGWTGEWRRLNMSTWVYDRFNSKGVKVKGYSIVVTAR